MDREGRQKERLVWRVKWGGEEQRQRERKKSKREEGRRKSKIAKEKETGIIFGKRKGEKDEEGWNRGKCRKSMRWKGKKDKDKEMRCKERKGKRSEWKE